MFPAAPADRGSGFTGAVGRQRVYRPLPPVSASVPPPAARGSVPGAAPGFISPPPCSLVHTGRAVCGRFFSWRRPGPPLVPGPRSLGRLGRRPVRLPRPNRPQAGAPSLAQSAADRCSPLGRIGRRPVRLPWPNRPQTGAPPWPSRLLTGAPPLAQSAAGRRASLGPIDSRPARLPWPTVRAARCGRNVPWQSGAHRFFAACCRSRTENPLFPPTARLLQHTRTKVPLNVARGTKKRLVLTINGACVRLDPQIYPF